MKLHSVERHKGFTLVELMVAMVLSILVVAGVLQVYLTSSDSYRSQESAAQMMESGRTATEILARALRMAGYWKCTGWQAANLSNHLASAQRGLFGTNGTSGASDTLRTLHAMDETAVAVTAAVELTELNISGLNVTVTPRPVSVSDGSGFAANDLIVINDCAKGDVFQISSVTGNSLGHACTTCVESYGTDSRVLKVEDTNYFVANNDRGEPALFRSVNGAAGEELLEGVEDMQIFFGEDTDSDGFANRYVSADVINAPCASGVNPSCWLRVTSVRISLLMRASDDYRTSEAQTYTYNGTSVTATDNRLRRVFTTVVALRNHRI